MAAQEAQLAALAEHDRIVRSTQCPVFRGDRTKDLKAREWMDGFEVAAKIGKWTTDDRKINEFFTLLKDQARSWYFNLDTLPGLDLTKWSVVKERFLKQYDTKGTAKTICHNFKDLQQRPRENVKDFYVRVAEVFKKIGAIFPDRFKTVRVAHDEDMNDVVLEVKNEGVMDMIQFIMEQMFLAGMHEKLRIKLQESGASGLLEVLDKADELERFEHENRPGTSLHMAPVAVEDEPNDVSPSEDLEEDDIAAINAYRQSAGKAPFRKPSNTSSSKTVQCRYCKKHGHFQRDCKRRKNDKAPMVDAQGKAYQPRQPTGDAKKPPNFAVRAVDRSEKPDDDDDEPDIVGYVNRVQETPAYQPAILNW